MSERSNYGARSRSLVDAETPVGVGKSEMKVNEGKRMNVIMYAALVCPI